MSKVSVWRILSILALLIYTVLVILTSLLLVKNIALTVVLTATSLLLAYCIWSLFTYTGTHKEHSGYLWMAVVAFLTIIAELLYFLSDSKNRRALLAILFLTVLYLYIFKILRKKYWASLRRRGELTKVTANFKNAYLIINPKSGDGRAIKANIDKLAKEQGIKVIKTKKNKDISETAMDVVRAGADVIGISGGDGSIGAVAKVAMKNNLPIVVLPGGTRCHFARDLGLNPKQIVDSLTGFKGIERRVDVGEINGRIFVNNASFGLYADIVSHPEYRENKLQITQQVLQSIVSGTKELYSLQVNHKKTVIKKAVQILVGVNRYNSVNLLEFGQRPKLDEGVLQVSAVTKLSKELIKKLLSVIGTQQAIKHGDSSGFYQWTETSLVIKSKDKNILVGVDGECESYSTPVKIRILPKSLRIYTPAEGVRGRGKNPLSSAVIKKIWENVWHETPVS